MSTGAEPLLLVGSTHRLEEDPATLLLPLLLSYLLRTEVVVGGGKEGHDARMSRLWPTQNHGLHHLSQALQGWAKAMVSCCSCLSASLLPLSRTPSTWWFTDATMCISCSLLSVGKVEIFPTLFPSMCDWQAATHGSL